MAASGANVAGRGFAGTRPLVIVGRAADRDAGGGFDLRDLVPDLGVGRPREALLEVRVAGDHRPADLVGLAGARPLGADDERGLSQVGQRFRVQLDREAAGRRRRDARKQGSTSARGAVGAPVQTCMPVGLDRDFEPGAIGGDGPAAHGEHARVGLARARFVEGALDLRRREAEQPAERGAEIAGGTGISPAWCPRQFINIPCGYRRQVRRNGTVFRRRQRAADPRRESADEDDGAEGRALPSCHVPTATPASAARPNWSAPSSADADPASSP